MLKIVLIGMALIGLNVIFHAAGTFWWNLNLRPRLKRHTRRLRSWKTFGALASTGIFLMCLLFSEAVLWSLVYYVFSDQTGLKSFDNALYFSLVSFTTVGYGDITLPAPWRILGGIEAMNGILMFGWSTASLYTIVHFLWSNAMEHRNDHET
jgi:hypothetical protein